MNRTAAAHTARGSLSYRVLISKLSILGSSVGPGRSLSGVFFSDISVSTSSFAPAPPLLRPAGISSSPALDARGCPLPCACRAAAALAKCPFAEKDVCRVVPPGYAPLCQKVYLEQGLPDALGTSTMRILAPVGSYKLPKELVSNPFPFSACSRAPGCTTAGASYLYSEGTGPPRAYAENLGAQEVWGTTSTNGPVRPQPIPCRRLTEPLPEAF